MNRRSEITVFAKPKRRLPWKNIIYLLLLVGSWVWAFRPLPKPEEPIPVTIVADPSAYEGDMVLIFHRNGGVSWKALGWKYAEEE